MPKNLTPRQIECLYTHTGVKAHADRDREGFLRKLVVNPKRGKILRAIEKHNERKELDEIVKETWEL